MWIWIPESARFLVCCGEHEKGAEMLKNVAKENKKGIDGAIELQQVSSKQDSTIADLFRFPYLLDSLAMTCMWTSMAVGWYGVCVMLPTLLEVNGVQRTGVYEESLITPSMQFPGLVISWLLADYVGR